MPHSNSMEDYKKLFGLLLVLAPLPITSFFAIVTGIDAIALLSVVTGSVLAHLILKKRGKSWSDLGFSRKINWIKTSISAVLAAVCLLVLISAAGSLLTYLTGLKPDISKFDVLRGNVGALIAGLIVVWTTAAFGEELLFRGFILNELKELFSKRQSSEKIAWILALLISSAVFGLGHAYQGLAGIILTAIAGLGYGIVYLVRKRNLRASILTHGLYDTLAFFLVFASYDKLIVSAEIFGIVNQTV